MVITNKCFNCHYLKSEYCSTGRSTGSPTRGSSASTASAGLLTTRRASTSMRPVRLSSTHRENFLKSYKIKPKSDCIYHFPIDLEANGHIRLVPSQSVHGKYNLISV